MGGQPTNAPATEHRLGRTDLIWAAWLIVLGLVFTRELQFVSDIRMPDETTYMGRGLKLATGSIPAASDAPLYGAWYYFLSFFRGDAIQLHYFNQKLMIAFLGAAACLFFRSLGIHRIVSFAAAWFLMIAGPNVTAINKSNHLAMIMLLAGIAWCWSRLKGPVQSIGLSLIALTASYVRPEYYLAFVIFAGLALRDLVRARTTRERLPIKQAVGALVLIFMLHATVGNPGASSNNRLSLAFGQHFSVNYVHWNVTDLSPWTDWERITAEVFGDSTSIGQAMLANPPLFFRHVFDNAIKYLRRMCLLVVHGLMPVDAIQGMAFPWLLLALTIAYYAGVAKYYFPALSAMRHRIVHPSGRLIFVVLAVVASSCLAALAIYPNRTYILIQVPLILGMAFAVLESNRPTGRTRAKPRTIGAPAAAAILGLLALPPISVYFSESRENFLTIQFIRDLDLPGPIRMMEAKGGYGVYLGPGSEWVPQFIKDEPMSGFIERYGINAIEISDELLRDSRFRDDPEWLVLLDDPARFGFERMEVPQTRNILLIRSHQ